MTDSKAGLYSIPPHAYHVIPPPPHPPLLPRGFGTTHTITNIHTTSSFLWRHFDKRHITKHTMVKRTRQRHLLLRSATEW